VEVGILGGTFNPIHLGHLLIAEESRTALGLAAVVFAPAGQPWMKLPEGLAPREDRWRMVELATASNPHFRPSRVDLDRLGPSYAVDTVKDVRRLEPGVSPWFIMGVDAFESLPQWRQPERLLGLCGLVVVARPGHDTARALAEVARLLPGVESQVRFVEGIHVDISATDIRRRCREGRSIKYRVPEAVESYILERGLYR